MKILGTGLVAVILWVSVAPIRSVAQGSSNADATLHVRTLRCLNDYRSQPTLRFIRMNDRDLPHAFLHGEPVTSVSSERAPKHLTPGVDEFVLRLPAANYELYGSSSSCFSQTMVALLPGRERSVALAIDRGWWNLLFDHDHSALAGTLDMPGAHLELTNPTLPLYNRVVPLDRGAFYVDSLQRMRWVLRVSGGCCGEALFPIDLSGVRPGDYATVALTAADVVKRLGYNGPLFSDPGLVSGDADFAWYTNPGRSSVGRIATDGTHVEVTLPGMAVPELIVSDRHGGAWFSKTGDGSLWHVDESLTPRPADLPKSAKVELIVSQSDGSVIAFSDDSKSGSVYRVKLDGSVAKIEIPVGSDVGHMAVADETLWLNMNDVAHALRLSGDKFIVSGGSQQKITSDITRIGNAFFYVSTSNGGTQRAELTGIAGASSGHYPGYLSTLPTEDGLGGFWVADCPQKMLVHVTRSGEQTSTALSDCPIDLAHDAEGGVWLLLYQPQAIAHVSASGAMLRYSIPTAAANVANLSVDGRGHLWFSERAINCIGLIRNGKVQEFPLGNPGATPGFTVVP